MPRNEPKDHPLLAAAFFGKCWALLPAKLDEILVLAEAILDGKKIDWPEAAAGPGGARAQDEPYQVRDGVAVVRVYGVLDKRMNMFSKMSGGTSYELLGSQIWQAQADPQVKAILFDVDSPGGSVDGVKTVADQILAFRGQKPMVAFANGQMASAAYWIGAAADQVVAPATAMVGSIGTRMVHRDLSGQDAQKGVKRTVIYSGQYKNVGSDAGPLSPEDAAVLQEMSDTYYHLFVDGVAQGRGQDSATVHEKMGDGKVFIGKKALKAGLIDQIGNFDDALALARAKGGAMPKNMTKAILQAENPELFQAILAEGAASVTVEAMLAQHPDAAEKLRAEGVTAERTRVMEILAMEGDAQISVTAIKEGQSAEETAPALLKAEKEGRAKALADLQSAAPPPAGQTLPVDTFAEMTGSLPIEKQAMKEWDDPKDGPKLKQEFGGQFSTYLAFRQAEVQGQTVR